ncbi:MAG: lipid A deacylase LpxR family protein [Planctomycetota bacterium]
MKPTRSKRGSRIFQTLLLAFSLNLTTGHTTAEDLQPDTHSPFRFEVIWNNDGSVARPTINTDRHYTNGLVLNLTHQPAWAQTLAESLSSLEPHAFAGNPPRSAVGYLLGHRIYTPVDIEIAAPLFNERPYAGYLYGGLYLQYDNLSPGLNPQPANDVATFTHLELNLGLIGPSSGAESLQTGVHDFIGAPDPLGWDNQLEDEAAVQAYARRKWRFDLLDPPPAEALQSQRRWNAQLIPEFGLALGTVDIYAELALTARYGLHLPDDFGPPTLFNPRSATAVDQPRTPGWSFYVFARGTGRAVVHDVFIEGNVYQDSPFGVEEEPLIAFLEGGIVATYHRDNCALEFGYSLTTITDQFETQSTTDGFGQLFLALNWQY